MESPSCTKVTAIVRSPVEPKDFPKKFALPEGAQEKLQPLVIDYEELAANPTEYGDQAGIGVHDVAFNCLGTTRSDAGSAQAFVRVDLDYATALATYAKHINVKHFGQVSSTVSNLFPLPQKRLEK